MKHTSILLYSAGSILLCLAGITGFLLAQTVVRKCTVYSGTLAQQNQVNSCGKGDLYIATDLPLGQQQFICGGGHAWFQTGTLNSPILNMTKGSLGINTAMFSQFASVTIPTSTDPGCIQSGDVGKRWINNSDPNNTPYSVCLVQNGLVGWVRESGLTAAARR